jgi:4-amino-4-deoxy-L-arabinose transferase-like glycosyltransferase
MSTTQLLPRVGIDEGRSAASPFTFLILLASTFLLRLPALVSYPFCIDESYYSAGATELLAGGTFYRHVVDHKPPGIYLLYALIYRVAGAYNQLAVHLTLLLAAALTAYLVGLLAQEFFTSRTGRWAGLLYAAASVVGPANDFQAANTELFMNLPLVAACWLGARLWMRREASRPEYLAMGFCLGLAILIRPQAAVVALPMAVVLTRRHVPLSSMALLALGTAFPLAIFASWLWRSGALPDAMASLAYARFYASSLPLEVKLANGTLKTLFFLAINVGLVIPATAWILRAHRHDAAWQTGTACVLLAWLAASFLAVGAGGRFYPHYFIQVLPPFAVLAARQLTLWRTEAA